MTDVKLWDETKTPNLVQWGEKFLSDDAAKDVIPGAEELVEFVNMRAKLAQTNNNA